MTPALGKNIAIVGAGWAGLAAAVQATLDGHHATVFEAAHAGGGRARAVAGTLPDGSAVTLDNGQHLLIGAYRETLRLLRVVGVEPEAALLRTPLNLQFADGGGLRLPAWPSPLDALLGILGARGWSLADKWSLVHQATRWQADGFACAAAATVAQICLALTPRVHCELIEPLCVSALNLPADQASGAVFLRVLHDALLGARGSSNLLLPRVDLSALFPNAALRWLQAQGAQVRFGQRVTALGYSGAQWQISEQPFDAVILATSAAETARTLAASAQAAPDFIATQMRDWSDLAAALPFTAIATVYAWAQDAQLRTPMLSLRSHSSAPAQFVFDRGQLGGPPGLLAFVVSACTQERAVVQQQVLRQAQDQLGLSLKAVQTIVEKRATFACTPGLRRPGMRAAPRLLACGDYVDGPYPATLEGAVRSGVAAVVALSSGLVQ